MQLFLMDMGGKIKWYILSDLNVVLCDFKYEEECKKHFNIKEVATCADQ